jgi:cytochrome b561
LADDNKINRYDSESIFLHWILAALVIISIVLIEMHDLYPKGSTTYEALKSRHGQLGFILFFLTLFRLIWRLLHPMPPITPEPKPWETMAKKVGHTTIYITLLSLGLLGIVMGNFFLNQRNKELVHTLKEAHETLGNFLIVLIAVHVAATLWHTWVRHDDTLRRMLPWRLK